MEDLSYMRTEYANRKMVESYNIDAPKCFNCQNFKKDSCDTYKDKKIISDTPWCQNWKRNKRRF